MYGMLQIHPALKHIYNILEMVKMETVNFINLFKLCDVILKKITTMKVIITL